MAHHRPNRSRCTPIYLLPTSHGATAATVRTALERLSTIGTGNVAVEKLSDTNMRQEWKVTFQGTPAGTIVNQLTINITGITTMPWTPVKIEATDTQGSTGTNEVQTVTLNNVTAGTFRLAFNGETSRAIPYNTSAADVESALEALNAVDQVTVTGNAGGPWTVTFVGTHSNINVPQMGGDAAALMSGSVLRTISYAFDAANQLTSASDPDSAYAWTYDNVGTVLTTSNAGTPGVPTVVLTNTWNAATQLTSAAATIGGTADYKNVYTRDNLGRSTIIEQTGQAGGNSVHDKRVRLEYNGLDQYTKIVRENKPSGSWQEVVTSNLSYDTLNRLTGLDYERAGTDVFTPYAWTFDKLSRPTQLSGQDGTSGYGYDVNSQLVSADHSFQGDESYSFDLNGNRTMSGWETGANNRLLSDGIFDYAYDNEGNLISRTNIATGELREFLWDYRNRLIQVTDKDNEGNVIQVIKYVYDVFDLRIGRLVDTTSPFDFADAAIERYVLDGGDVVLDFVDPDGNGSAPIALAKRYLHGEAVDQVFAQEDVTLSLSDGNRTLWFLTDDLGTVRDLMRGDGTMAAHYKFEAFGKPTSGDTSKTRFLFTSREFDPATGLQYNRARSYDPATGRWISEDPMGFAAGDGNLARYVGNGGTLGTDPTGLWKTAIDRKAYWQMIEDMHQYVLDASWGIEDQEVRDWISGDSPLYHAWYGAMMATIPTYGLPVHLEFDLIDAIGNVAAGFVDTIIPFGLMERYRNSIGMGMMVDTSSWSYGGGTALGIVWSVLIGRAGGSSVCKVLNVVDKLDTAYQFAKSLGDEGLVAAIEDLAIGSILDLIAGQCFLGGTQVLVVPPPVGASTDVRSYDEPVLSDHVLGVAGVMIVLVGMSGWSAARGRSTPEELDDVANTLCLVRSRRGRARRLSCDRPAGREGDEMTEMNASPNTPQEAVFGDASQDDCAELADLHWVTRNQLGRETHVIEDGVPHSAANGLFTLGDSPTDREPACTVRAVNSRISGERPSETFAHSTWSGQRTEPAKECPRRPSDSRAVQRLGSLWLAACLVLGTLLTWAANRKPQIQTADAQSSGQSAAVVTRNIEDVRPGDHVLAWDLRANRHDAYAVDEVYERTADHLRIIEIDSGDGSSAVLRTTDEHPFWVEREGWVNADQLEAGDRLRQSRGRLAVVVSTSRQSHPDGVAVFNLRVPGVHNYFAGEADGEAFLVHNADYNPKQLREAAKEGLEKINRALRKKFNLGSVYERPSGSRKGVRTIAWEAAKGADGQVRDPLTGRVMDFNEPWDMGHKPGHEFSKHRESAAQRGLTREEFLDEHNNPDNYRPELPDSNRSHRGEDKSDTYLGP